MASGTKQKNVPTGRLYNGIQIEELPYFLYEATVYKIVKNGFSLVESKFYKSDKLLKLKKDKVIEKHDDYILDKSFELIGAPHDFYVELPVYELKKKCKK